MVGVGVGVGVGVADEMRQDPSYSRRVASSYEVIDGLYG